MTTKYSATFSDEVKRNNYMRTRYSTIHSKFRKASGKYCAHKCFSVMLK